MTFLRHGSVTEKINSYQSKYGAVYVQSWTNPVGASATAVHAAVTLGAAAQDVNTSLTAPDFPRNVSVTGNASGIAGNVVVTGTNIRGVAITETIALSGSSTVVGNKAFATVTNVNMPAKTNSSGDTVSVGVGVKLGLERLLTADLVLATAVNGTYEATRPTVAKSSTAIESNTIITNTAPNGSKPIMCAYVTTETTTAKRVTT